MLKNEYGSFSSDGSGVGEMTEQDQELGHLIGQKIDWAAHTVQDTFQQAKKSAKAAMETVTDGIDTSAEYFTDRGVEGVVKDVETLIRRHPFQALVIGLSIGYLLSRLATADEGTRRAE